MSKKKSETMEPLKELKTTNKKTLDLYMKYPSIDFVTVNNLMVDIIDNLYSRLKLNNKDEIKISSEHINVNVILNQ